MWVHNAWYVAGWLPEFAPGSIHARTIIDQPIALYRTVDGGLAALEDRCCHRFAPLSMFSSAQFSWLCGVAMPR